MKKSLITIVAFLLVCTSVSHAQIQVDSIQSIYNIYDFDFVGSGTRAKGMGNAFIGVSNDVTGGSWNPAGIFELDKTTMGISWLSMRPRGNSSIQSVTDLTEANHSGSLSDISSLNFISPIRISGHPFVFSLNLTRNFTDFSQAASQVDIEREFITFAPNGVVYYDTNNVNIQNGIRVEGSLNSINLGFGTRLYDNYSFGAAINIYTGNSLYKINTTNTIEDFRVYTVQRAQVQEFINLEDTNKFSGMNFTLGFMYNSETVNAGLTVRTPFKLSENRERGVYQNTELNEISLATDTVFISELYKYDMPLMVGAGIGYQLTENLLLAGDVEYRGFSGNEVNKRVSLTINPGSSNIEEFVTFDPKWNNSFSVRVGVEYMNNFDFANIPIRAGYAYVPVPGTSLDPLNGSQSTVVNNKITFGSGLHFEQIYLDIAYVYNTNNFETVGFTNDSKNHNIDISFTGVF